jgi:glycosyltransferase involved in cell wall biosynthesis
MFTIITPTYNREQLVQATIKSILEQIHKDWELIIVDDGSTDNTEQAVQQYLTDPRIKYIKKENSGQAASLNAGASCAKGDFIAFLDSDDEAYPEWLNTVHAHIGRDTGIVCAGAMRKMLDGTLVTEDLREYRLFGQKMRLKFTCGSLFIRRTLFSTVGGYDAEMRSNIQTDLGYRLLAYLRTVNLQIVTIDKYLVQINVHEGPRIRTNWNRMRDGGIQFLNKHYHFIRRNNPKDISNICSTIAFSSYKLNKRGQSVYYLLRAIRHNPFRWINYMRIFKYVLV